MQMAFGDVPSRILCFAVSLVGLGCARGVLLGAAVIPHGDFAYDPTLVPGSGALHSASLEVGRFVAEDLTPDVVFITTPHGLELSSQFLIYENSVDSGSAPIGGDVPHGSAKYKVPLTVNTDVALASQLREQLTSAGLPVSGIRAFADSEPLPVSWGEVIPLSFLNRSYAAKGHQLPPVVIMGVPFSRYNHSVRMVPEMLRIGAFIAEELESLEKTVAWVVSADLAHTHQASGPYGYCPCAQPYDDAVRKWLTNLSSPALLQEACKQQGLGAMSCGFTGLVLLEGALQATSVSTWKSELLALGAPTYYGMGVAKLTRAGAHAILQPVEIV